MQRQQPSKAPRALASLVLGLIGFTTIAGCASTQVSSRQEYKGPALARPDRILIYDFAATPSDLPDWSVAAGQYQHASSATGEELQTGRKLGALVAQELVSKIRDMGLPAMNAATTGPAQPGDLVIIGYFLSVDSGSTMKRMVVGFGSGSAELKTNVEGYLGTETGLRFLGGGDVDSSGSKGPGMAVPLAVTIATANPIGLIVSGAVKATGEVTGRSTIEGAAERTAQTIADEMKPKFVQQGWLD